MNQERWDAVDEYIKDVVVRPDAALDAAIEASTAAGLPPINVSPSHGKFLFVLARTLGAKAILEIGTLGGYSTIWMARGLVAGGRVIAPEADPKQADVARANFVRAGVGDAIELRLGKALDTLPKVASDGRGPFDLIFIDADKPNIPENFSWALKLGRVARWSFATALAGGNIFVPAFPYRRTSRDTPVPFWNWHARGTGIDSKAQSHFKGAYSVSSVLRARGGFMWGDKKPEAPARPPVAQQPRPTVPNATFNSGEAKTMAPTDANYSTSGGTARLGASLHIKGEITGNEDLQINRSGEGLVQLQDRKRTVGA